MSLADTLNEFRAKNVTINNLVSIAYKKDAAGIDLFDEMQKDFIISSTFLQMFILWEAFLESTFCKYLLGELSTNGTVVNKYANAKDSEHALKLIIGTQKYVDWANQEIVRRLASLYLENGEPYNTNLLSISSELADLKTVRNAAAHLSSTTQPQLNALSNRVLGAAAGNSTVASFIMSIHPLDTTKTVFQYYQNMLDITAENIAGNII